MPELEDLKICECIYGTNEGPNINLTLDGDGFKNLKKLILEYVFNLKLPEIQGKIEELQYIGNNIGKLTSEYNIVINNTEHIKHVLVGQFVEEFKARS